MRNRKRFGLDIHFFAIKKRPGFEPGRFCKRRSRNKSGMTFCDYFKNCMYGSLAASSCTLSALAIRAERACQEPSRN